MPFVLAIDQSTSATKAVILDLSGRAVAQAQREHRQIYPRPGWVEHDAEEIWQNVQQVAREACAKVPMAVNEIIQVSLTNQRETVIVFQRDTGRPLHNAIVWQCRRGEAACLAHREAGDEALIQSKTGLRIDSYFSAPKLEWLLTARQDFAEALKSGEALLGTMDTYLVYRLTGASAYVTDHTNASRTLLYDIHRLDWDEELCELWRVHPKALPALQSSDAEFGETDLAGLLPRPVRIRGIMGDSHAAFFGHRCVSVGDAKATFGTGCSVLVNVGSSVPPATHGAVATLAWVRNGVPTYALEGIITAAASTLTWLQRQLGIDFERVDVASLDNNDGIDDEVYLVPAFSGLGAPHWTSAARAAIVGLTAFSDQRHVVRAALHAIGYQLGEVIEMMRQECNQSVRTLRADGGPTANAYLMQFVADILDVELLVRLRPDAAPCGAALMGLAAIGIEPEPTDNGESSIYRRHMSPHEVRIRNEGWRRSVRQVLCAL